jgi:hypothetical protein
MRDATPDSLWKRRAFLSGLAVATAGLALGERGWRRVAAQDAISPLPIPGGSPGIAELGGTLFHVYGPGTDAGGDPPDAEPITITDFNGMVGLAYISGMATRTNTVTGESRMLPFVSNDMRFMKGAYRGTDGQVHQGAFALI